MLKEKLFFLLLLVLHQLLLLLALIAEFDLQGPLLTEPLFLFWVLLPAEGVAPNDKTLLHFFNHQLELVVSQRGVIQGIF